MPSVIRLSRDAVEPLRELLRVCWLDTYAGVLPDQVIRTAINEWQSRDSILLGLSNPDAYYAGYYEGDVLCGMVSARMVDAQRLRVSQLYVRPGHQRKGIGRMLLDTAIAHFGAATTVILEVEERNPKGVAFYRKYGFDYPRRTAVKVGGYEIPCLVGELHLARP